MKITQRSWRWILPTLAALAWSASGSWAQQPLSKVELAEPIAAEPAEAAGEGESATAPAETPSDQAAPAAAAPAAEGPPIAPAPPASPEEPSELAASDDVVEMIKERFPGGAVKVEREMTQDNDGNYVLHGAWRQFDEQGRLIIDGKHERGQKIGLWRKFYRAGDAPLLATAPYKDFTPPFISQANFHNGQIHGKWTITDSKQRKIHDIEFCDGQRHGKATWFHSNGAILLQAQYEHGRVNGDVMKFGADSTLIAQENYHSGRMLAPKVEFYDANKQIKKLETTFLHATLVVKTPDSWDACTLATFENRGNDERHGPFTAWHKNGQPAKQGEYRYNLPVGKITYWFDNGQKQMEGMYVDGRQEGVWTWWHANGQKSITGEYHDASPVGKWAWWKADGKVAQKADLSGEKTLAAPAVLPEADSEAREAKLQLFEPGLPLR